MDMKSDFNDKIILKSFNWLKLANYLIIMIYDSEYDYMSNHQLVKHKWYKWYLNSNRVVPLCLTGFSFINFIYFFYEFNIKTKQI